MLTKEERIYVSILGSLLILFLALEYVNDRLWMNDLRVYYEAAQAFLQGRPVYGIAYGLSSGYFKYAPPTLIPFSIYTCLPFSAAQIAHFVLMCISGISGLLLTRRLIGGIDRKSVLLVLSACTLLVGVHWYRELHLGNINLILLLPLIVAYQCNCTERDFLAGLLVGMVILYKPHFIILLPVMLWYRKFFSTAVAIGTIVTLLGFTYILFGELGADLFQGWLASVSDHNAAMIHTGGAEKQAINTIYSVIHKYGIDFLFSNPFPGEEILTLCIVGLFVLGFLLFERTHNQTRTGLFFLWIWSIALVPSLTLTDTNHFLLTGPLILWILSQWDTLRKDTLIFAATVCGLFAYSGNWADLLGPLSPWMVDHSILGVGNLLILAIALKLRIQTIKRLSGITE